MPIFDSKNDKTLVQSRKSKAESVMTLKSAKEQMQQIDEAI